MACGGRIPCRHDICRAARADRHRPVVPRADRGPGGERGTPARRPADRPGEIPPALPQAPGIFGQAAGAAARLPGGRSTQPASGARHTAGLQAGGYLRRGVLHGHRLHVFDLRGRMRIAARYAGQDHGDRGRPEPHRAGHRVRLLLCARGTGLPGRRFRDHHGQLQPGDRVHRLRHL